MGRATPSIGLKFNLWMVRQIYQAETLRNLLPHAALPLDAQADHLGPLGGGVVDALGDLDALALQFPLQAGDDATAAETAYRAAKR